MPLFVSSPMCPFRVEHTHTSPAAKSTHCKTRQTETRWKSRRRTEEATSAGAIAMTGGGASGIGGVEAIESVRKLCSCC